MLVLLFGLCALMGDGLTCKSLWVKVSAKNDFMLMTELVKVFLIVALNPAATVTTVVVLSFNIL